LAQERETYLRNKRLHQEEMKTTLDNQVNRFNQTKVIRLFILKIGEK